MRKQKRTFIIAMFCGFLLFCISSAVAKPILINATPGKATQKHLQVFQSGAKDFYLVWEDFRSGLPMLYAQKINEAGEKLWAADGIPVSSTISAAGQTNCRAIVDQSGALLLAWQNLGQNQSSIVAQKINSEGKLLWGTDGTAVCATAGNQMAPDLCSDGSGGAIMTWFDYRGADEDVYAQAISSSGKIKWQKDGIALAKKPGTQWYPRIVSDYLGGAVIAWSDNSAGYYRTAIQRVDAKGEMLWEQAQNSLSTAEGDQLNVRLAADKKGVFVFWQKDNAGKTGILFQKIDYDGQIAFADTQAVALSDSSQLDYCISSGQNRVWALWLEKDSGGRALHMQAIGQNGEMIFGAKGIPLYAKEGEKANPAILAHPGGVMAAWQQSGSDGWDIYANDFTSGAEPRWGEGGVIVCQEKSDQIAPTLALNANGSIMVGWSDRRSGTFQLYGQLFDSLGQIYFGASGLGFSSASGNVAHKKSKVIECGDNNKIIVWEDARAGYFGVYAQKINQRGEKLWTQDGVLAATIVGDERDPEIVGDLAGGAYLIWQDYRSDQPQIRVQHLDGFGQLLWGTEGIPSITIETLAEQNPKAALTSDRCLALVWERVGNTKVSNLWAQKISSTGTREWGNGTLLSPVEYQQEDAQIIGDGRGGAILTWTDYRNGLNNSDIYAQRVDQQGRTQWGDVRVCGAPGDQIEPSMVSDGQNGAVIAWGDAGGAAYDIYMQRLDGSGNALWNPDGNMVCVSPGTQRYPQIVLNQEAVIVVWEDFRYENWDIFAQKVNLITGTLAWDSGGIPVCVRINTQYAPALAADGKGNTYFAWEDYRNGDYYQIFLQQLDQNGRVKSGWPQGGKLLSDSPIGGRNVVLAAAPDNNSLTAVWDGFLGGQKGIYAVISPLF